MLKKILTATALLPLYFTVAEAKEEIIIADLKGKEAKQLVHMGKDAIYLKNGSFKLDKLSMQDGTIRFKLAMDEGRGFSGVRFRASDAGNAEEFYIRHHLSGKPDANQYSPVYGGNVAWQLYHGKQYAVPFEFENKKWQQVEIRLNGDRMDVILGDGKSRLKVPKLKRDTQSGEIFFYSFMSPAYFADIEVEKGLPDVAPDAAPYDPVPENGITTWQVSDSFKADDLGADDLSDVVQSARTWQSMAVEEKGIVNLSKAGGPTKEKNTRFAKVTLHADKDMIVPITVGYSDVGRVYLNGAFLFEGDGRWQSRDYRYLGTIGLFDKVPLRLKKGDNEVMIAVTERFGGWGVMATLPKVDGLTVK